LGLASVATRSAAEITPQQSTKLSSRYFGPSKIIEYIGDVAYRLQLLTKAHIHDVFHVTLLKKFEGKPPDVVVPLPSIHHGRVLPVPNKILYARLNRGTCEVLVSWQHWPPIETTWENVDPFKLTYPDKQLVNVLFLGEGGNVIDFFMDQQYQRRKKTSKET
jgi:hypothetical protein